jgi:hypothetical protein
MRLQARLPEGGHRLVSRLLTLRLPCTVCKLIAKSRAPVDAEDQVDSKVDASQSKQGAALE